MCFSLSFVRLSLSSVRCPPPPVLVFWISMHPVTSLQSCCLVSDLWSRAPTIRLLCPGYVAGLQRVSSFAAGLQRVLPSSQASRGVLFYYRPPERGKPHELCDHPPNLLSPLVLPSGCHPDLLHPSVLTLSRLPEDSCSAPVQPFGYLPESATSFI